MDALTFLCDAKPFSNGAFHQKVSIFIHFFIKEYFAQTSLVSFDRHSRKISRALLQEIFIESCGYSLKLIGFRQRFFQRPHVLIINIFLHAVSYSIVPLSTLHIFPSFRVFGNVLAKQVLAEMSELFVMLLESFHSFPIF